MFKTIILLIALIFITSKCFGKETRIKIGIIDTGVSFSQAIGNYLCKKGRKSMIKYDSGIDRNGHGKNIFGLIAQSINPKTHCIISYKFWKKDISGKQSQINVINALKQAIKDKVKYINMSLGGESDSLEELVQIKKALNKKIIIFAAAGNEFQDLNKNCNYYPACHKKILKKNKNNLIIVGAHDVKASNYGSVVNVYTKGKKIGKPVLTGTSQATANYAGKYINKKSKSVVRLIPKGKK